MSSGGALEKFYQKRILIWHFHATQPLYVATFHKKRNIHSDEANDLIKLTKKKIGN
jgi:hypothetical protein